MSVKFLKLRLSNTMDVLIQRPANISSLQAEVSPAVFSHFINFVISLCDFTYVDATLYFCEHSYVSLFTGKSSVM